MAWVTAAVAGVDAGSQMMQMQQQSNLNLANRTFSAQQAALNRQFQAGQQLQAEQYNTQMSDTALQRRMADAQAAGINPMLAVTTGGASAPMMSAPGGSQANTPSTANPAASLNPTQAAMSGLQAAQTLAQTRDTAAHAASLEATNPFAAEQAKANIANIIQQSDTLKSQAMKLSMDYNVGQANQNLINQNIDYQKRLNDLDIQSRSLEIAGRAYGLTRERLLSEFYQTPAGQEVLRMQAGKQGGLPGEIVTGTSAIGAAAENVGNTIKGAMGGADQTPVDFPF